MDHLQVSVLALRETIDRQEHRIEDLRFERALLAIALAFVVVVMFIYPEVKSC